MATSLNLLFANNTGLGDDEVFVTFQNPALGAKDFKVTYSGGKPVSFAASNNLMSNSLSLKEVGPGGFSVEQVQGVVIYISYGAALTSTTTAPSYIGSGGSDYGTRFQQIELTHMGNPADQGNLTAINFFTAPQSITSYNGGVQGTRLQYTGYTSSAADIGEKLSQICPGSVVRNAAGEIIRYLGPSAFSAPPGLPATPWPSFADYLQTVNGDKQKTNIQRSNAFISAAGINCNFTLHHTGTVQADNTIQLDGEILTTVTGGAKPAFRDASITIPGASAQTLDYIIYGQTIHSSINWGKGWEDFKKFVNSNNIPGAYETTRSLAIGEITTGLLLGYVNSSTLPNGCETAIKDLPSEEWWNLTPPEAFAKAQSTPSHYNQYAEVIYDASTNLVYSIPFSDRLGDGPLVNSVQYGGQTVDAWVVGLGATV